MKESQIEQLAFIRQLEIENDPHQITCTFDAVHLLAIHAYLFQDSSVERKAGTIRLAINDVHSKKRTNVYPLSKPFFYHPAPSFEIIDKIIAQAHQQLHHTTDDSQKIKIISTLYADLDYQHPFVEGNSRTLRIFIEQFASKYNIHLDWRKISNVAELYRARDFEIACRNLEYPAETEIEQYMREQAERHQTKAYISAQISLHRGRYLTQIIQDCCTIGTTKEQHISM